MSTFTSNDLAQACFSPALLEIYENAAMPSSVREEISSKLKKAVKDSAPLTIQASFPESWQGMIEAMAECFPDGLHEILAEHIDSLALPKLSPEKTEHLAFLAPADALIHHTSGDFEAGNRIFTLTAEDADHMLKDEEKMAYLEKLFQTATASGQEVQILEEGQEPERPVDPNEVAALGIAKQYADSLDTVQTGGKALGLISRDELESRLAELLGELIALGAEPEVHTMVCDLIEGSAGFAKAPASIRKATS